MRLKELRIRLMDYGPFEGKYVGEVEFSSDSGSIKIHLSPELSPKVLALCADTLVAQAKETAGMLVANVITQTKQQEQLTNSKE